MTGPVKFSDTQLPVLFILGLACLLRVLGIHFGLPDLYHADEPIVVNHAMAYGTGDFNPHFFKIPPLTSYLLFILYGLYFMAGRMFGLFGSADDFASLFLFDPSSFYLLGRVVMGAFLGTATVYALYRLGRKYFSSSSGLIAGFFLAVAFLHVRDSHYIYTDIPLVFVLLLSFFPIFQILREGHRGHYLLFGCCLGLATALKYNGIFITVPFFAAHILKHGFKKAAFLNASLWCALISSFAVYSLFNPFSWLNFNFFMAELRTQSGAESFSGFLHHLKYSLNGGIGTPLLLLACFEIIRSLIQKDPKKIVIASFVLVYYGVLCALSQPFDRYALPLVPFLLLFAAEALHWIKEKFSLSHFALGVMVLLVAAPTFVKSALSDYLWLQKDTRTLAKEWIIQHIPAESKIALELPFFAPRLSFSMSQLREKAEELSAQGLQQSAQSRRLQLLLESSGKRERVPRYQLFFLKENPLSNDFLFAKPSLPYDFDKLRSNGIEYVITAHSGSSRAQNGFYEALERRHERMAVFTPYRDGREESIDLQPLTGGPFLFDELIQRRGNGQTIKVYRLR